MFFSTRRPYGYVEVCTISVKDMKRQLYLPNEREPLLVLGRSTTNKINDKAAAIKQRLLYRYDCRYRPSRFFPLEDLPDDILYMILPYLSLADTACLALVSQRFYPSLAKYACRINNKGDDDISASSSIPTPRHEFLQRLDKQMKDWYLCKFCHKYYRWTVPGGKGKEAMPAHICQDHEVPREGRIAGYAGAKYIAYKSPAPWDQSNVWLSSVQPVTNQDVQLVMRAAYYKSLEYGLPLAALNRTSIDDGRGWRTTSTAVFDKSDNLIIRLVCTPLHAYSSADDREDIRRTSLSRARCCALDKTTALKLRIAWRQLWSSDICSSDTNEWSENKSCRGDWHECEGCGAIFAVRLSATKVDWDKWPDVT
jgi:hypothetical protein